MKPMLKQSLLLAAALVAPALQAEVPVFRDRVLAIDKAVVVTPAGPAYYANIRLQATANGAFTLVEAERRPLAIVETLDVLVNKSNPVQVEVHVTGVQTVACVGLEEPVVTRNNDTFTVLLAETLMAPATVCMSLLAVTPFQRDIDLPVEGLSPGATYKVVVNGKEASFRL